MLATKIQSVSARALGLLMRRLVLLLISGSLLSAAPVSAEPATGRVQGKIDCPAAGDCLGVAALWSAAGNLVPAVDRYVLTPAVVSALNPDGSFELIAPVGDYFVAAQLRKTTGALFGAPRVGDRIFLMKPQDETGYRVSVVKDQLTDIGFHSSSWPFAGLTDTPPMGVSGQVLDPDKQPVAGLLVFAFADPEAATTPLAVSSRTGEDGRFVLPLPAPGTIYLRARESYRGGQPQGDDYVSAAAGSAQQPVQVASGQLRTGVEVAVRKLPSVLQMKNAPGTARPKVQ